MGIIFEMTGCIYIYIYYMKTSAKDPSKRSPAKHPKPREIGDMVISSSITLPPRSTFFLGVSLGGLFGGFLRIPPDPVQKPGAYID